MAVDSQESINHTKPGVFFPSLYGVFWMFSLYGDCFTMRILLFLFFFLSLSLSIFILRGSSSSRLSGGSSSQPVPRLTVRDRPYLPAGPLARVRPRVPRGPRTTL